jgi:hypothetical protein
MSFVACPALQRFSTLSHKPYDFPDNIIAHKMYVLIFSASFSEKISHSEEMREILPQMYIVLHKVPVVAHMGEDRGVHRVLVGKPEGKRPLGGPRRRWEDNIKMDLQEAGGGHGGWMGMARDRGRWWGRVGTV